MNTFLVILAVLILSYIGWHVVRTAYFIRVGRKLAHQSAPFSRKLKGAIMRVLVIGDSSGVGVGASHPARSLVGLLGQHLEGSAIVNHAENGACIRDALRQLKKTRGVFDFIFIFIGGNDVVDFTPLAAIRTDFQKLLALAGRKGAHILLVTTGDIGDVLLFPAPIRWILSLRSHRVHDVLLRQILRSTSPIHYADPFGDDVVDPFALNPKKYLAPDLFHPNDAGYAAWFDLVSRELHRIR